MEISGLKVRVKTVQGGVVEKVIVMQAKKLEDLAVHFHTDELKGILAAHGPITGAGSWDAQ